MTTKEKGNVGESKIIFEFVKRGIQVSIPFGDNARYDLIAEFNGKLNKIQVKYGDGAIRNGSVKVHCSSVKNHTTNKRLSTYQNDVDYIAFYIEKWDASLLVPISVIGDKKTMSFRNSPTGNEQKVNVHDIQDYSFDKILSVPIA